MADAAEPVAEPRLEPRVARLEADVGHIRADIAEIKATLNRLAPLNDEFRGFMAATSPPLATKTDLADLRAELKSDLADQSAEQKSEIAISAPGCALNSCGGRKAASPSWTSSRLSG
jgi:hypothetical protein